jgi:hypothetical protein
VKIVSNVMLKSFRAGGIDPYADRPARAVPSYLSSSVPSNACAAAMARSINGIVGDVRQGSLEEVR